MYIKRLMVENVRGFRHQAFSFSPGLNIFVGENNAGKSTVFEALMLLTANARGQHLQYHGASGPMRVEAVIAGDDLELQLADDKYSRYRDFVFRDSDGEPCLRVERSDEARSVMQAAKNVQLDGKKLCLWHPERAQFENPTGIDAVFRTLVDLEPIWATAEPDSVVDFGTTKTLGKMLAATAKEFFESSTWHDFEAAHQTAFGAGPDSLSTHAAELADRLTATVNDQYGEAAVRFEFSLPDPSTFVRSGEVRIDDGSGETPLGAKGSGMQRAFALAVIQEFARARSESSLPRPQSLTLLIDEPETWLHPRAQQRLGTALRTVALSDQVFLATHSPYLFGDFTRGRDRLVSIAVRDGLRSVRYETEMGVVSPGRPSVGEINFTAFAVATSDFHNELYGALTRHLENLGRSSDEKGVDQYLCEKGVERSHTWARALNGVAKPAREVTLPVFVRNSIHHPENELNPRPTESEMSESTLILLQFVRVFARGEAEVELTG